MNTLNIKGDFIKISLSRVITLVISLISAMLLARLLSLEEYGTYSQILLVVNLSNTLIILGLPSSINFFLARTTDYNEKTKFLSTYYTVSTLLGITSGIFLLAISQGIVYYFDNNSISNLLFVLIFLPWAQITMSSLDGVMIVNNKTSWLVIFRITHSILLVFSISIAMLYRLNLVQYMWLYIIIESIFTIIVYILAFKTVGKIKLEINVNLLSRILMYSVPIGVSGIVGTISLYLDKLVIGRLMSTEYVALYANAGKELPIAIITASLITVLLPRFISLYNSGEKEKAIEIWKKSLTISYALMCFFATYLIVYAPQVVTFLYSSKYLPAVGIFRIYSLILLLRSTYFGMGLSVVGKTKYIMYISAFALLMNLILNLIFYRMIGFNGPAVATELSTRIQAGVYTVVN